MSESGYWAAQDWQDARDEELIPRCIECGEDMEDDEHDSCPDCRRAWDRLRT